MRRETTERLRITVVLKTNEGGMWIVPHIREMLDRGHHVSVVIPGGSGRLRRRLDELDVDVEESEFDFGFRPSARTIGGIWKLRKQLRRLRPDVIHYHLYASALAARLSTIGWRVPRVHMVAGPLYLDSRIIRMVEPWLVRLDTVVVAGSEHTAERYRALCRRRLPIVSIPYGVSTADYVPPTPEERELARAELKLDDSNFVFVMVAMTYAPKKLVHSGLGIKGHDVILDAWRDVSRTRPDARLFLVGGGFDEAGESHRQQLIQQFEINRPESTVQWFSTVADVRPYYAAADVSVCPSLSENHGAALEATASGVPCIVSDAGALPETVTIDSGWVVPAGDSGALAGAMISTIRAGRPAARDMGAKARESTSLKFESASMAHLLVNIIEEASRGELRGC